MICFPLRPTIDAHTFKYTLEFFCSDWQAHEVGSVPQGHFITLGTLSPKTAYGRSRFLLKSKSLSGLKRTVEFAPFQQLSTPMRSRSKVCLLTIVAAVLTTWQYLHWITSLLALAYGMLAPLV